MQFSGPAVAINARSKKRRLCLRQLGLFTPFNEVSAGIQRIGANNNNNRNFGVIGLYYLHQ